MKSEKPDKPAEKGKLGVVSTQNAAARAMGVTAKTISAWKFEGGSLAGFREDGSIDLRALALWFEQRSTAQKGGTEKRESKLTEEIRKLRIANDEREGRTLARTWIAERIQIAAGELNGFRAKSEAEHPLKFAAASGDVAQCRMIVRGIWDDIFAEMVKLSSAFAQ